MCIKACNGFPLAIPMEGHAWEAYGTGRIPSHPLLCLTIYK